ncbi:hypothetical protein [Burkholderia cenocepacia]|uniref:hypothetical protein n=1 Tax=Burkholderia cenocepacia TaxID=95486 RepID=UPI00222F25BF|nr:hypothetical protein [Burkholderia cenocepacia]MCW3678646.1 hypothetical protein [Burkholderia cenocepacia]
MDTLVYRYKTLLMQRLIDWVSRGYCWYAEGTVKASRAYALCEKFDALYFTGAVRNQRFYRKQNGKGNAALLLADIEQNGTLHWWLLVTDGVHPAHQSESLLDVRDRANRIRLTGYELLQLTNDKRNGGKVRWTWRMIDETFDAWQARIRAVSRGRAPLEEMPSVIRELYRSPGFHGNRTQVSKLTRYLRYEWERAGRRSDELAIPSAIHYVKRLADEDFTIRHWLAANYPDLVPAPAAPRSTRARRAASAPQPSLFPESPEQPAEITGA